LFVIIKKSVAAEVAAKVLVAPPKTRFQAIDNRQQATAEQLLAVGFWLLVKNNPKPIPWHAAHINNSFRLPSANTLPPFTRREPSSRLNWWDWAILGFAHEARKFSYLT